MDRSGDVPAVPPSGAGSAKTPFEFGVIDVSPIYESATPDVVSNLGLFHSRFEAASIPEFEDSASPSLGFTTDLGNFDCS